MFLGKAIVLVSYMNHKENKGLTKEEFIDWIDNKVLIEEDGTQMDDARYFLGYQLLTTQKKKRDTADYQNHNNSCIIITKSFCIDI